MFSLVPVVNTSVAKQTTEGAIRYKILLKCVAVCCSVLQCVAVWCSVLQCVAVCCSVLQCVVVCCNVVQ